MTWLFDTELKGTVAGCQLELIQFVWSAKWGRVFDWQISCHIFKTKRKGYDIEECVIEQVSQCPQPNLLPRSNKQSYPCPRSVGKVLLLVAYCRSLSRNWPGTYLLCANLDFKEIIYRWASREPRSIVITRCRLQLGHSMAFHTLPLAAHL